MQTFEEFFNKKKIDLSLLQKADRPLYEEFRNHYAQMGEKSFDHTKKFWFNSLRKKYHLNIAPAVKTAVKTEAPTVQSPDAKETSPAPARFKSRSKATAAAGPTEQSLAAEAAESKPAGFKPRFKPGTTKPALEQPGKETKEVPEVPEQAAELPTSSRPTGFKPRFKAGLTKPAAEPDKETKEVSEVPEEPTEQPPASKPAGFKPRFKAGV
ncbi:MAG: hypothetical protein ACTIKE_09930, partial [Sphingobacterium sp.]